MKVSKKILMPAIIVVSILFFSAVACAYTNFSTVSKADETEPTSSSSSYKSEEKALLSLYSSDKKEAFATDLSSKKIEEVKGQLNKIENNTVKSKLLKELNQVEFLYETHTLIDNSIPDNVLKDDFTEEDSETINNRYDKATNYNKIIAQNDSNKIDSINQQFEDIKNAKTTVHSLFINENEDSLIETVTQEDFVNSRNLIDVVQNTKEKNSLNDTYDKAVNLFDNKDELVTDSSSSTVNEEVKDGVIPTNNEQTAQTNNSTTSSSAANSDNAPQEKKQTGIEGIIASSPSAQYTDQIIGVVASGSSADVYLFEKNSGVWSTVLTTSGLVGSSGVGQASEATSFTPKGSYGLTLAFGTGGNPGSSLPYRQITSNSYWISNVNDPEYNTWQERETSDSADEHLMSFSQQYQYAIALDYNAGVGGGSAFFLHVSNGSPTAGCIAVPLGIMQQLITRIHSGARIINVNYESELSNY